MNKSQLKTGMVVQLRDGQRARVLLGTGNSGDIISGDTWFPIDSMSKDMRYGRSNDYPESDVMKVYQPQNNGAHSNINSPNMDLIWEREGEALVTIKGKEYSESTIIAALKNHLPE